MSDSVITTFMQYVLGPILVGFFTFIFTNNRKHNSAKSDSIKLIYHPIFARLKALERALDLEFSLSNRGKEAVFRCILQHKISIFYDNLYELAKITEDCIGKCTSKACNEVYNRNMKIFEESVTQYNTFFLNNDYTIEEQRCLELVMTKFNRWFQPRLERIVDNIQLISDSQFYTDCRSRQGAIFDIYIGTFAETVTDAGKTLNEINGDLRGLIFKGTAI